MVLSEKLEEREDVEEERECRLRTKESCRPALREVAAARRGTGGGTPTFICLRCTYGEGTCFTQYENTVSYCTVNESVNRTMVFLGQPVFSYNCCTEEVTCGLAEGDRLLALGASVESLSLCSRLSVDLSSKSIIIQLSPG